MVDMPPNQTKPNQTSVMLELWGMQNTPSLPSLQVSLMPRVIAYDRVQSMGKIEVFDN